jgi:TonB family protein
MNNISVYDELNQEIERMITTMPVEVEHEADSHLNGCARERHPAIAELVEVAGDLRRLPRPDFKTQLKVELEWQAAGRTFSSANAALIAAETRVITDEVNALPMLFGKGNGLYPIRGINVAASVALHAALLLFAGLGVVMVKSTVAVPERRAAGVTLLEPYVAETGSKPKRGGGSGGGADKLDASQGETVRFAREQLAPPTVEPVPSKLPTEATLVGPPDLNLIRSNAGNILSALTTPSAGPGVRGGIGSHDGGGIGDGFGPGRGIGTGGYEGGGFYLPGNGVTSPRAIFSPEPEYSDEARIAKYQGVVTLSAIIGPDGRPRHILVARSLGMGLDEKAMAAVQTWRFEPGRKDGRPVSVQMTIEVYFHLF